MKNRSSIILLSALLLGVGACSTAPVGQGDSETHWLRECNSTAECGASGSCVCGLCTLPCASDNECSGGPGGTCVPQGNVSFCDSHSAPTSGVCIVTCSKNSDCNADQRCLSNACVTQSAPTRSTPNAVTSGEGGAVTFALGGMGPNLSNIANAVSRDGSVVVGTTVVGYNDTLAPLYRNYEPMVWKAGAAPQLLNCPGSSTCEGLCGGASGVSGDGSVVVGDCYDGAGVPRAFRASSNGLDIFGAPWSDASGANADGSVVIGTLSPSDPGDAGTPPLSSFRWTNGELQDLGRGPGADGVDVSGVSSDGSIAAGSYTDERSYLQPFLWSAATGLRSVQLTQVTTFQVRRMSSDGTVLVGRTDRGAAIWSESDGLTLLGCSGCAAFGVNRDGSVVVGGDTEVAASGNASFATSGNAFVWDASHGRRDLLTMLKSEGADLGDVDQLAAYDVSDDGTVIVGQAHHPGTSENWEAFRATLPR